MWRVRRVFAVCANHVIVSVGDSKQHVALSSSSSSLLMTIVRNFIDTMSDNNAANIVCILLSGMDHDGECISISTIRMQIVRIVSVDFTINLGIL